MPLTKRKIVKWTGFTFGGILLVVLLVIVLAIADTLGFFHEPPLNLVQSGNSVIVHVETLGEYQTTVGHLRLKEADSGKIIYEVVAEGRAPQIFNFRLVAGDNSTKVIDPEEKSYRVVEPRGTNTFTLQSGVKYRLRIWGDSWTYREASFKL
jgi:hypothetical protein